MTPTPGSRHLASAERAWKMWKLPAPRPTARAELLRDVICLVILLALAAQTIGIWVKAGPEGAALHGRGYTVPAVILLPVVAIGAGWWLEKIVRQMSVRFTVTGISARFWLTRVHLPWDSIEEVTVRPSRYGERVAIASTVRNLTLDGGYYTSSAALAPFVEYRRTLARP